MWRGSCAIVVGVSQQTTQTDPGSGDTAEPNHSVRAPRFADAGEPADGGAHPIQTEPAAAGAHRAEPSQQARGRERTAFGVIALALGAVVAAPVALSSQDLYRWGAAPGGLGLDAHWPLLVPLSLDFAAVACIGMTIIAAWRRERPGIFGALVWVFAIVSAYAQVRHGLAERDAGRAQDAWWAMPAFALLGPFLLHAVLSKLRTWARKDKGEQHHGAAGFGTRWLPGVAFKETLSAWTASRREGIDQAGAAIAYVRERAALAGLSPVDAMHYAFGALGTSEPHPARVWLAARGLVIDQATIDAAVASLPAPKPAPVRPEPAPNRRTEPARTSAPTAIRGPHRLDDEPLLQKLVDDFPARDGNGQAVSMPTRRQIETHLGIGSTVAGRLLKSLKTARNEATGEIPLVVSQ